MKFKANIPAFSLALLVFVATTGVSVFEHICTTSQSRNFSFFSKPTCEMEKQLPPCCAKLALKKKKGCCEHKEFFSKLSVEGFTAKQMQLKPADRVSSHDYYVPSSNFKGRNLEAFYSGLAPPDNLYDIRSLLQPSPVLLQIFRC